jgi:hypothetical protein
MSGMTKILVALLLIVSLTACSSDGGGSSSTTGPTNTDAASETTLSGETTLAPETTAAETNDGTVSSGLNIDPCGLLTSGDITAATGVEFGDGTINETMTRDGQTVCDWISTGSEFAIAQVLIVDSDVFDSNKSSAEEVFGLATDPVAVPGADRTYATAEGSIVAMDIGGIFLQVSYIPSAPGNVADATLELAAIAADRMP